MNRVAKWLAIGGGIVMGVAGVSYVMETGKSSQLAGKVDDYSYAMEHHTHLAPSPDNITSMAEYTTDQSTLNNESFWEDVTIGAGIAGAAVAALAFEIDHLQQKRS